MTGPIEILHVNVDQTVRARYSRAAAATGGCETATPLAWTGETDLTLRAGEAVCVQVSGDTRVSWHARAMPQVPTALPPPTVPSALAAR